MNADGGIRAEQLGSDVEQRARAGAALDEVVLDHAAPQLLRDAVEGNDAIVSEHLARCRDLPGRLPEDMARLRVPELKPHAQNRHARPDDLDPGELEPVENGVI